VHFAVVLVHAVLSEKELAVRGALVASHRAQIAVRLRLRVFVLVLDMESEIALSFVKEVAVLFSAPIMLCLSALVSNFWALDRRLGRGVIG
jgi:hypothetical protein